MLFVNFNFLEYKNSGGVFDSRLIQYIKVRYREAVGFNKVFLDKTVSDSELKKLFKDKSYIYLNTFYRSFKEQAILKVD